MAEPKAAEAGSPWFLRILLTVLGLLAAGVLRSAGADLWEIVKLLVKVITD